MLKIGLPATAALLTTFSLSFSAHADSVLENILTTGELKVCFEAGYIPFEMMTKAGDYIGFDIDMSKSMARAMGVKFVPVNTAWDGIIPALQTGKCDIIAGGMTITAERNLKVNFADPYITVGQTVLLAPKLKDKVKSYKDLNDAQYTIVTMLGTTGANAVKRLMPNAKVDLFETQGDSVLQLTNGKADAFVYDLPYNSIYQAQHQGQVVHLNEPFTYEPLAWAIRQNDPNFLNFLNNYLRQIKGDGTYDRIYAKWFKSASWLADVQ